MPVTQLSRRRFLQQSVTGLGMGLSAGLLSPVLYAQGSPLSTGQSASQSTGLRLASSVKTDQAGHQLLNIQRLNIQSQASASNLNSSPMLLPSGWRGHQIATAPDGRYLVSVARRPDTQLLIQDQTNNSHYFVDAEEGRHFYGHGIFSADGKTLYCPENDYENTRGVIGIYSVQENFRKTGEWDSQGIGPHQIAWLNQGDKTLLVIANGGIETHPDYPRIKLNLESMQPNISYLDLQGRLVDQVQPKHHQLSLRHLDVSVDGQVWVGAQFQGEVKDSPNLIYSHRLGEKELTQVQADQTLWPQLKAYIASVSCHSQTDTVCITAPRDNLVTLWQRSTGQLIQQMTLADCAGVCAHPTLPHYFVSSGDGTLAAYDANNGKLIWQQRFAGIHWDNHLSWIS